MYTTIIYINVTNKANLYVINLYSTKIKTKLINMQKQGFLLSNTLSNNLKSHFKQSHISVVLLKCLCLCFNVKILHIKKVPNITYKSKNYQKLIFLSNKLIN